MTTRTVIINNDYNMRNSIAIQLSKAGWESAAFSVAEFNLVSLIHVQPELIMLDLDGSGPGWDLLQILREETATARIPIVVTTSHCCLPTEIKNYLLANCIPIVPDPYDVDSILPIIRKTLTSASQSGTRFTSDNSLPILVVDDSDILREELSMVLSLEGYQVAQASNGQQALEAVYHADYGLILLDIAMPQMNGFEFLRAYGGQLRPHTPVIIISAEPNIKAKVLPTFVVDVLDKPFEILKLLDMVKNHVRRDLNSTSC
jgi:DNA-binding response OmpR family regulator